MIWSLTRPADASLERIRASQSERAVTYVESGASLGDLPEGYDRVRDSTVVGDGRRDFELARAALRDWAAHRALGMGLAPPMPPLEEGETMAFALRVLPLLPLWVTGCCRIVRVVDDADRFGFAYGTLPHHPECGEESFVVRRLPADDVVVFEIAAFSRPASALVRLSGAVGRRLQRRSVRRYLEGLRAAVVAARSS